MENSSESGLTREALKTKILKWVTKQDGFWYYIDICEKFNIDLEESVNIVDELIKEKRLKIVE